MPPPGGSERHTAEYITLRDYFERLIAEQNKATGLAYQSMERRLDGMNEFRDTLRDQGLSFLTKAEYYTFKTRLEEDIRTLRESKAMLEGKASQSSVNFVTAMAVIGIVLSVVSIAMRLLGV